MGSTQSTWGLPSVTATMVGLLGLSLVFFSALVAVVSYEYSAEECRSLGFNRANLLCSSCNYLEEFDLSALENECRACFSKKAKVTRRCFTRKPSSRSAGENWVRTHKSKHSLRVTRHVGYPICRSSTFEVPIPSLSSSMMTVWSRKSWPSINGIPTRLKSF